MMIGLTACGAPLETEDGEFFSNGVWAPDGSTMVFLHRTGSGVHDLWLLPQDGEPLTPS